MAPQFPHTAPTDSALPRRTAFVHGLYIVILLIVTAVVSQLRAATILWSSSAGSAWLTGTNWTGNAVPTSGDVAQFGANPTAATGVGINFANTTNAGTQTNGQRVEDVGAIEIASTRAAAMLVGNSSGTAGATGTLRLLGTTVNGVANTIIRNASGQLLTIQNTQATGNQTMGLALGNATNNVIAIDGAGGVTISSVISGSGPLTLQGSGSGILSLSGANTYTGGTNINAGILSIANAAALGSSGTISFGGGTLRYTGITTDLSSRFSSASSQQYKVDTNTQNVTWASALTSSGGTLTKSGAGAITLSGANTYSGGTTLSAGQIALGHVSGLGTGSLTVGAGAQSGTTNGTSAFLNTVALTGTVAVANDIILPSDATATNRQIHNKGGAGNSLQLTGTISGGGSGTILFLTDDTGDSAGIIRLSGTNTFTGSVTLNRGSVQIDSDAAFGATANAVTLNSFSGQSLIFTNAMTYTHNTAVGFANAAFNTGANNVTASGVISTLSGTFGIIKTGSGNLTLNNTNTYNGGTTVNDGVLVASGGSAIPDTSAVSIANTSGVGLQLSNNETVASIAGGGSTGGTIELGSNTLRLAGTASTSFSGVITGSGGALTKTSTSTGTLTLSGANTYTGGTNLGAGIISVAGSSNIGSGAFNVTATGTQLTVTGTAATFANDFTLPSATGRFTFLTPTSSSTTINGTISGGNPNTDATTTGGTEWFFQGGASGTNSGALTLNGNNSSMQGTINVQRGPLILGNANAAGTTVIRLDSNIPAAGALQLAGNINVANKIYLNSGTQTIGVGGALQGELSGVISSNGALGFAKVGTGALTLSGANTYSGGTTLSVGRLNLNNASAIGTGAFTITGGSIDATVAGVVLSTNNVLNLNGDFSFAGTNDLNLGTGAVTLTAHRLITVDAGTLTIGGNITSADFTISKQGNGTLKLTGSNAYSGVTTINSGVLSVSSVASLGTGAAAVSIDSGSNLQYTGNGGTLTKPVTVTSGTGTISNTGGGTLDLNGTLTKSGSVLKLTGGTFTVSGQITGSAANSDLVVDNATVTLANATNDYNGPTIVQNGGKVIIAGNESYLGKVPTSTTAGNLVLNNGTLNTTADVALSATRGIAVGPTSGSGSGTLQADSGTTMTVNGVIANNPSGTGSLSVSGAGTVDLKAANTYSGGTTISSGTLLASNSSGSATGSGTVTVNGTASTILGGTGTISGATTVSVGQIKPGSSSGTGILNFGSDVTLSGSTPGTKLTVRLAATSGRDGNDAALIASHLVDGTFATWVLDQAATYEALNSGTHDKLIIGGSLNLNLGGQIVVDNTTYSGYTPALGDIIDLFDFAGGSLNIGTFNTGGNGRAGGLVGDLNLPALSAGLSYDMSLFDYGSTASGIIIVVPEPSRAFLGLIGIASLVLRRCRRFVA